MRIRSACCIGLLLLFVCHVGAFAFQSGRAEVIPTDLTITFWIYNYAQVGRSTLRQAHRELTEIFQKFGVQIQWAESNFLEPRRERNSVQSLKVIILGRSGERLAPDRTSAGFTPKSLEGDSGRLAYVFYSRIEDFARSAQRFSDAPSFGMARNGHILAHIIAHEAGHMLLPTLSHSEEGIMRCQWKPDDLRLALKRELLFTQEQVELMRLELDKLSN